MHRACLLQQLSAYQQWRPLERDRTERIAAFVRSHCNCFERACRPGHVTGSAWVVSEDRCRFLLVHHRKLGRWLQPGGHADGDADVARVALREAREETGLNQLVHADVPSMAARLPLVAQLGKSSLVLPFDLDVHVIPARYDSVGELVDEAHEHHDVRFLVVGRADAAPQASAESYDARWLTAREVADLSVEESVLRMLQKSLELIC